MLYLLTNLKHRKMEHIAGISNSPKFIEIRGVTEDTVKQLQHSIKGASVFQRTNRVTVALSLENCYVLRDLKIPFTEDLKQKANALYKANTSKSSKTRIKGIGGDLKPFQVEGVSQIDKWNGRCILGDEMGLGKTVQALAWLQLRKEVRPAVIVCPASLKLNWKIEAEKWMSSPVVFVAQGSKPLIPKDAEIIIINYNILPAWVSVLKAFKPKCIIMDEMHYVKARGTKKSPVQRTRACIEVCKGVPHVIGITGTPIENMVHEIFTPCSIIKPRLFPSEWHFKQRYCDPKYTGFGWEFKGASNTKELHKILKDSILIRRLKKDVLKELPDKSYVFVPFEIDNKTEYKKAENEFKRYLKDKKLEKIELEAVTTLGLYSRNNAITSEIHEEIKKATNPLNQIETLKQLATQGIMKSLIEWVHNFLLSDEKIVLFATHKNIITELMEEFKGIAVKVDGGCSMDERHEAVNQFQNNPKIRIFVGNIKAAGVGLTLTKSCTVGMVEYPWNPSAMAQAIDRVHRITQTLPVTALFFTAVGTIVEKIIHLLHDKQKLADNVLNGADDTGTILLKELLQSLQNEK